MVTISPADMELLLLDIQYHPACDPEIKLKELAILEHVIFPSNAIPSCVIAPVVVVPSFLFIEKKK
jgi:hypothetical protein